MADKKKEKKNPAEQYLINLQAELKRLNNLVTDTKGMSDEDQKFWTASDEAKFKSSPSGKKLKVINYGRWAGPKGWRQKAGSLSGRINLIEQEIARTTDHLGSRYVEWGHHYPRGKESYDSKGSLRIPTTFKADKSLTINGRRRMVNPDYNPTYFTPSESVTNDAVEDSKEKLQILKNNTNTNTQVKPSDQGNGKQVDIVNNNNEVISSNTTTPNNETVPTKVFKKNVKEKAVANPEWKDIEWAEKIATEKNIKNAKSFMNRARDIQRAYGSNISFDDPRYESYEKRMQRLAYNPITQLELEA